MDSIYLAIILSSVFLAVLGLGSLLWRTDKTQFKEILEMASKSVDALRVILLSQTDTENAKQLVRLEQAKLVEQAKRIRARDQDTKRRSDVAKRVRLRPPTGAGISMPADMAALGIPPPKMTPQKEAPSGDSRPS